MALLAFGILLLPNEAMERIWLLIVFLCFAQVVGAQVDSAQRDQPLRRFERPDPPIPTSSTPKFPDPYVNRGVDPLIRIKINEIPHRMEEYLESKGFIGWRRAPVFLDDSDQSFRIDIREGDGVRSYRFDADGNILKSIPLQIED